MKWYGTMYLPFPETATENKQKKSSCHNLEKVMQKWMEQKALDLYLNYISWSSPLLLYRAYFLSTNQHNCVGLIHVCTKIPDLKTCMYG